MNAVIFMHDKKVSVHIPALQILKCCKNFPKRFDFWIKYRKKKNHQISSPLQWLL